MRWPSFDSDPVIRVTCQCCFRRFEYVGGERLLFCSELCELEHDRRMALSREYTSGRIVKGLLEDRTDLVIADADAFLRTVFEIRSL